jgi:hypothetical protein
MWPMVFGLRCTNCWDLTIGCSEHWFCGLCDDCRVFHEDDDDDDEPNAEDILEAMRIMELAYCDDITSPFQGNSLKQRDVLMDHINVLRAVNAPQELIAVAKEVLATYGPVPVDAEGLE